MYSFHSVGVAALGPHAKPKRTSSPVSHAPPGRTAAVPSAPELPVQLPLPNPDLMIVPGVRYAKCSDYVDPIRKELVRVFDSDRVDDCRKMYAKWEHEEPDPDIEPSAEQLSVMNHLLENGHIPFADFSIWGPYNERFQRSQHFTGLRPGPDGTLQKVQIYGPPTVEIWIESFNVLAAALISFDAVVPPIFYRYRDFIHKLVKTHGAQCWGIIYQAEVRLRREGFARIKRRLVQRHKDILSEGLSQSSSSVSYDPARPWNAVFAWAIEEKVWDKDVFTACIQVGAKIKNPSAFIQGDAPIVGTPPPPRPHPAPRDPKPTKAQAKKDRARLLGPTPPPPPKQTQPKKKK